MACKHNYLRKENGRKRNTPYWAGKYACGVENCQLYAKLKIESYGKYFPKQILP